MPAACPSLFLLHTFRKQTLSSCFKLALPCGFLNWAVGSQTFPHRPMFCTRFGFKKNTVFFLSLAILNFHFFFKKKKRL